MKQLYQSQSELGTANEAIARKPLHAVHNPACAELLSGKGSNLSLQDRLYQLRSETKEAFDEAKALEAQWKELDREQRELYQVRCSIPSPPGTSKHTSLPAIYSSISLTAPAPCDH